MKTTTKTLQQLEGKMKKPFIRWVAIVTAITVLALALTLQRSPHLLLKIPKIGFILFAKLAGGSIPPYIDPRIHQLSDRWLKKGDVFVSVPTKSGTHWMMYTLHLMRARGDPEPFSDIYLETPWPDFVFYPGQSMKERIEHLQNVSRRYPFSIFKTHLSPNDFAVRDDVKYVVVVRNTFDAIASLRTFYKNISPQFASMWGGFPPGAGKELSTDAEWEKFITRDSGDGTPFVWRLLVPTEIWWQYRKNKNVLFIHFSDRLKDDHTEIRRIANFIGIDLSPEQLDKIVRDVSFTEMRKVKSVVELHHMFDPFKQRGKVHQNMSVLDSRIEHPLLVAGPKRSGERENTPTMKAALKRLLLEKFGPEISHWIEHGGPVPMDAELPSSPKHH